MKIFASDLDGTAIRPVESVFGDKKSITEDEARQLFEPEAVHVFDEKSIQPFLEQGHKFVFCTRQYEAVARVIIDAMFPGRDVPLFARWPENENPRGKWHLINDICKAYNVTTRQITLLDDDFFTIDEAQAMGCCVKYARTLQNKSLMWAVNSDSLRPPWL